MKYLQFTVSGFPAPKGSMRGSGKHVIPSGSAQNAAAQKDWGKAVREEAVKALAAAGYAGVLMFVNVPLRFTAIWRMKRLKPHFVKKGPLAGHVKVDAPLYPIAAPDTSKLLRSTEDWLNDLVYDDDSRIVETQMRKIYVAPGQEGAFIKIEEMEEKP